MLGDKINSFRGRSAKILGHENTFKSAVLLPLIIVENKYFVLFEKRAFSMNRQPGEICFPGGAKEPTDDYSEYTAIRESSEELGVPLNCFEVIAPLDIMVSSFNSIVIPYLAHIKIQDPSTLRINKDEVENILLIPLDFFLENDPEVHIIKTSAQVPDDFPYHLIPHGRNYPFRTGCIPQYFYIWEGETIWGLTASILHHFIDLLKKA
ncbi:putative nudix hydrolase yeab [hydrocarbon metagenome]|uniref:Putative nudix hydrolase yeab n=1 Tax=hydrocarbon metagenome TaxID=938273 RepID=A0A0W8E917_9ZZZZ